MRLVLAVLVCFALTGGSALAQDGAERGGPGMLARLLGGLLQKAGTTLSGDANEIEPINVDGTGNKVIRIDELVLNINIGDVSFEHEGGGTTMPGPWRERMRGMLEHRRGQEGVRGMEVPHPPMPVPTNPPFMSGVPPFDRVPHGMGEGMPMPPEFRPELLEMMMNIPPEVEPEFVGWMMHVGQLAWEHPEFRERLEELVARAEERLER